jgi:hypothetical protein
MSVYWAKNKYHKENTEAPLEASREIGLQVNAENTKYLVMYRPQILGQITIIM